MSEGKFETENQTEPAEILIHGLQTRTELVCEIPKRDSILRLAT